MGFQTGIDLVCGGYAFVSAGLDAFRFAIITIFDRDHSRRYRSFSIGVFFTIPYAFPAQIASVDTDET
jgi:hypothetical protein